MLKYPDLIIDEIAEGHEIGTHTYSHAFVNKLNENQIEYEIKENERILKENCDYKIKYIRPPGGILTDSFIKICDEFGYSTVLWSVDTRDWARPDASNIESVVLSTVKGGDIILMHDYVAGGPSTTPDALRKIISALLDKRYEFVTLSDLIASDTSSSE